MRPLRDAAVRRARRRSSGRRAPCGRRTKRRTCTRTSRSPPRRPVRARPRTVRTRSASRAPSLALRDVVQVEHREEGLLRYLDRADLLHPLLARLLLLEQLALPRDVAAVALREHVLATCLDGLARDHASADRRLDRDVEHLPGDLLAQPLDERLPALVGELAVDDQRERVDGLPADEDVDPGEVAGPEAGDVVVEARVAA